MIYEQLEELIEAGRPCALATLVSTAGSSPQVTGAKVIFLPDGQIIGTIGGGCMEVEARRIGLDCIRNRQCRLFEMRLDDDFGWDDGLICGGRVRIFINPSPHDSTEALQAARESLARREKAALCMTLTGESAGAISLIRSSGDVVGATALNGLADHGLAVIESGKEQTVNLSPGVEAYIEPILPRPTMLIAGAGHVGAAVAQIGALCGFEVAIVDDRPSFANRERLPFADRVAVEKIPEFVRDYPIDDQTYVVIVTRGHRNDAQVLRECIHSNARYIGMIGSKRKIVVIFEELLREGLATKEELRRVRSPMGLTLGDVDVGEIAVSIMAEIIAIRRGADLGAIRPMQYAPPFLQE